MRLLSLRLHNFMPYKGEHEIRFPVVDGRNVTIVYGDNMRGKTSLLNALRWALYGKVVGRHLRPIPLIHILNKDAERERDFTVRVALTFVHDGSDYELIRTMRPKDLIDTPKEDGHFELPPPSLKRGGVPVSGHLVDHEINQILPESISRFSLFDGELLQEYEQLVAEATTESDKIKEAIEKVLGVPTLLNARAHLAEILHRAQKLFEREGLKDSKHGKLIQETNNLLEDAKREVDRLTSLVDEARSNCDQLDDKLKKYQRAESVKSHVEENRVQQNNSKAARDRAIDRRRELAPRAWLALVSTAVAEKRERMQAEFSDALTEFVTYVEQRTAHQYRLRSLQAGQCVVCEASLTDQSRSALREKVDATDEATDSGLSNLATQLTSAARQFDRIKGLGAQGVAEDLLHAEREIDRCNVELTRLQQREDALLSEIPGVDLADLGRTREQRDLWQREIGKLETNLASKQSERHILQKKYDAAVKMAATGQQGASKLIGDKVTLLSSLSELFASSVDNLRHRLRTDVQAAATQTFKRLTTETQYRGLVINDRYGLEIRDHLDRTVSVRSAGAEQIVALSLIDGLNSASGKTGPLVMDTPFGRLDLKHRAHVLGYLPEMADQVVLLVHEGELSPERDLSHVSNHVAASYEIQRVSPTQSTLARR